MRRLKRLSIAAALALAAACSVHNGGEESAADASPLAQTEARGFEPVETDAMRPAFTAETVTALNAIVRRSLDVANEYTATIRDLRADVRAAAAADAGEDARQAAMGAFAALEDWGRRADAAKADMDEAVAALEASDEIYSEEILAGMRRYVDDVAALIRKEEDALYRQWKE